MKYIGKYQIIGLLGRGGMGKVYKVLHPELGKIMALKLLAPNDMLEELMGTHEVRRQFIHEAKIMGGLSHPNIASVWDLDQDEKNRPFMLMEYFCLNLGTVIGETYRVEDASRPLGPPKVFQYGREILAGIARLHHAGIIHRDIKPFNMMITGQDQIKLIDFGLSKLRGERDNGPSNLKIGSPYYTAPEQEDDPQKADVRSDIYSVGMVLYRLLTGRLLMKPGDRDFDVPFFDNAWDDFFGHCLAWDPAQRFASATEMLAALHEQHAVWTKEQEAVCRLAPETAPRNPTAEPAVLRSTPIKTGPVKPETVFTVDSLARPLTHTVNDFIPTPEGWLDQSSHLEWQRQPSPFPLTWEEAREYLQTLNQKEPSAPIPWRLPTVEELLTLVQPTAEVEDLCTPTIFDPEKKWFWSSDTRTFISTWFLDLASGYVAAQDTTCLFYVLPVRKR